MKTPALIRYVTATELPSHSLYYPPIGSYKGIENNTSITCIDPENGGPYLWNATLSRKSAEDMTAPRTPSAIVFGSPKGKEASSNQNHPSEQMLRYLSWQLHLKVTTVANAKLLGAAIMEAFGYGTRYRRGPYNGLQIWDSKTNAANDATILCPSRPVNNDVSGQIPQIVVNSTRRIRLLPILSTILRTWLWRGNVLEAWKAGCKAADVANSGIAEGDAPRKTCYCPDPSTSTEMHPCIRCLTTVVCASMRNDYKQERICSLCCPIKSHSTGIPGDHSSDKKGAVSAKGFKPISNPVAGDSIGSKGGSEESGKSKAAKGPGRRGPKPKAKPSTVAKSPCSSLHTYKLPAQTHPSHKAMYKTLKKRIMWDAKRCKTPREVAFARMEPGWGSLSQYALSDGQWQDGYCSTSRSTSGVVDWHMKDPFMPSLDAVFPYGLSDGQMQYHVPGNLVVTTLYINLLKYTYIPAMLAHLVNYVKSDHGPEAVKRFMKEMEDVYLVGLRTPYVMKKRLLAGPSEWSRSIKARVINASIILRIVRMRWQRPSGTALRQANVGREGADLK